ncbi:hypothetical protein SAMN04488570_1783 [Nocardioides scoriae]|uniref:Uncharacterized protein n=1 Tax=Nocardioides scoriae TaxID=642780 RepID=A0A1H1RUZ0_9ACTN|nr:hypothetical protein [Nocardioides scoriae]SDS39534.1 hypothetical protein SAMN04488570_1783 [Nocardioides scoriae]
MAGLLLAPLLAACGAAGPGDDAPSAGSVGAAPAATSWAPAPRRAQGLRVLAESGPRGFALHTRSGAKTFLPGINLGSSTPGHQPGEVQHIDAATYRGWFAQMHALHIRVVRSYTLHPPAFYDELARFNRAHPSSPLYLVQGVYLPLEDYNQPGRTLYTRAIDTAFTRELRQVSDAVHGDLVRPAVPGAAGGTYRTDVSPWVASWIVGVEWDPVGVAQTDRAMKRAAYRPGRYFAAPRGATATERWIARHMDQLATAEAKRGVSVPIAAANWPTADPLRHPTEPLASEDAVSVDAMHLLPTRAWPGGTFASFHAYPYYPDFQRSEKGLDATRWEGEPDRYAGYLRSLQRHFASRMPLVVSEFGVPSSIGSAHDGTRGRDQGSHSEQEAMAMDASMLRMMRSLKLAGGFVFSWEDEWFKRTWNTMEHTDPERRQLWHDPLTNEQWFGVVATDTEQVPDAAAELVPTDGEVEYVHVWGDHSFVHLEVTGRERTPTRLALDADVVPGPERADYRLRLDREADTAQVQVRKALDPIRLDTPGVPYRPDADAEWHDYALITNRSLQGRPAEFDQVGRLVRGSWDPEDPDYDSMATWTVDDAHRTVKVRLPWSMLGLADPSARLALGEGSPAERVTIDGIDLSLDVDGTPAQLDFTWPTWTRVGYTTRLKAGTDGLAEAYRDLAP